MTPAETDAAVLDALQRAGRPLRLKRAPELAQHLGITEGELGHSLQRLVQAGLVQPSKRGGAWRHTKTEKA